MRGMSFKALGRLPKGKMNKTEEQYAHILEQRKMCGEILWYKFEGIRFVLADHSCSYTPDFCVLMKDGEIQIHEVKGHWTDDARVKIKVAAAQFPFAFIAVKKNKGAFEVEEF